MVLAVAVGICVYTLPAQSGEWPKELHAYLGSTPELDGILSPGEYDDAESFLGTDGWNGDAEPVIDSSDLSMIGWVKHDGENLYFAFDVVDDVLYGFDIERWVPDLNPNVHELTQEGWPWFGDSVEIMMNARYIWSSENYENCEGNGHSWQMVASTHKSRAGGIGTGGMLEGEPRSSDAAWSTYQEWLLIGAMEAAVRIKSPDEGKGYIIEWMIKTDPCLEVSAGEFWHPGMGEVRMGMNIELQDVDEEEKGEGYFANMHHIEFWAGESGKKTWLKSWGTLILVPDAMPGTFVAERDENVDKPFSLYQNSPNPFNPATVISFDVNRTAPVRVDIYNINGQLVRTLIDDIRPAGTVSLSWNGRDEYGRMVSAGEYFYRLRSGDFVEARKMLFIK